MPPLEDDLDADPIAGPNADPVAALEADSIPEPSAEAIAEVDADPIAELKALAHRDFPVGPDEHFTEDPLLTPGEVAVLFRVDPKTVTRWARAGKLDAQRTLGGHRRFRASEIYRFLEEMAAQRH